MISPIVSLELRQRIGVMEMGLKSAQLVGGVTFGMGWMIDIFQESGMKGTCRDRLKRFAIGRLIQDAARRRYHVGIQSYPTVVGQL